MGKKPKPPKRKPCRPPIKGQQAALVPTRVASSERLARARALRVDLEPTKFLTDDIDTQKRDGRVSLVLFRE